MQARYALILYRDEGDLYTLRPIDFTESLDDFMNNLEAQEADGGGTVPEAMHIGLAGATGLDWDPANTARVMFLIADAPPHSEHAQDTLNALLALRKATIAVYPVTASTSAGINTELEFYMRAAAFLTGAEYIFLTDDSGVGSPHAEPHIPCYHVERLDTIMIRMIRSQLAGERIEPAEANIIRTVGNPVNGVCQDVADDQAAQ